MGIDPVSVRPVTSKSPVRTGEGGSIIGVKETKDTCRQGGIGVFYGRFCGVI